MNDETEQRQEQYLKYIVFGLVLTGLSVGLTFVWFEGFSSPWLLRSLALVVVALIAYALQKAGQFMIAAYTLTLELVGIVAGMFLQPGTTTGLTPYLFIPLVLIAALLLSPLAIIAITILSIVLTLLVITVTGQLSSVTLFNLGLPFGLLLITAFLAAGFNRYWARKSGVISGNANLAREDDIEMSGAQERIDSLQQRVVRLQQQVFQAQAETEQARQMASQKNNKFYDLIQGAIRELDSSVKQLEQSIGQVALTSSGETQNGSLEETWQQIDHLTNLAVNLEEMVRLENDEVELDYQPVDVERLLDEVANMARGLLGQKRIEVRCKVEKGLPPLSADPDRLRQSLLGLINNAIKYTDEGHIDLQAEFNDQEMTIFVSDTGIGMSPDEQEMVFEKFARSTKTVKRGTGLGLTISKYLVDLHRGRMWSTSMPNIGSTFYMALPLEPTPATAPEEIPVDEQETVLSLPQVTPQPIVPPEPVVDPERTVRSLRPEKPQPRPDKDKPKPALKPSLSPVARFSPTYISRFGFSLLGLLLLIAGLAGVLALINPPLEETSASTGAVEEATPVADSETNLSPTETPITEEALLPSPTAAATDTPAPIPTSSPTSLPTDPATETPTRVILAPTETPLPPEPTATPTTEPTTEPTASPTIAPPTATPTVSGIGLSAAVPAALVEPTVAPSTRLSFGTGNGTVSLHNLESELETGLTMNLETVDNSRLAWSPAGQQLLFTGEQEAQREIYVTDVSGSDLVNLTQSPGDDQQPNWSPDGQHIAFSSGRSGNFDIYVMDADGSNVRQLTMSRGFEEWPIWSPDGRQLAFISDQDGGTLDLYVMDADGSNVRQLTDDAADEGPASWSPDGRRLVFTSERDGNANLYIVPAAGGTAIRLTNDPANEEVPVWSPDGRTIAFLFDGGSNNDVYTLVAPTGTSVTEAPRTIWTQVTETPIDETYPVWQP